MKVIDMGAPNPWTSIINLGRHPRPRCDGRHIKVYLELELDWLVRRHRGAFRSMETSIFVIASAWRIWPICKSL
jgi:hypothetical protein